MKRIRPYIIALACLVVGTLIYLVCRTDILFVEWLHLDYIPITNIDIQNKFVYWLVYCLSDGLWYLALLIIQYNILLENSIYSRICAYVAVVLPFVIEILQSVHWISGTFDWLDIVTYLLTLILFLLCVKKS